MPGMCIDPNAELISRPPRRPWGDFPDVLIHANESAVKKHLAYSAAKAGDVIAAEKLVRDNFSAAQADRLASFLPGLRPFLVSAHAFEREGVNAIPEVFADVLGQYLGWPVDGGVVQTNVVGHTGADGVSRLARQAGFAGAIVADADYVMVDDFIGMGGTLANLRGHIESQGGRVRAAVALTGKPYSAKLKLSRERLEELRKTHGNELENWWLDRFGHAFDALTESEARYLVRTANADALRNRIAAAK